MQQNINFFFITLITLEEDKCGEIPAVPNGVTSRQQTGAYEDGQYAWIGDCKDGYQRKDRNDRFTCRGGNWTSKSSLETICERELFSLIVNGL